jgi:predicted RNA-binding Zn-ribbon protein involved in translation (DUF1610 family)
MDRKKVVAMAVLVVVIILAVVITMRRTSNEAPPPGAVAATTANAKIDMIDMKTLEVFSELPADWIGKYAPDASGHHKNPKTGEYTIVQAMKCASCGQLIPVPEIPADQLPAGGEKGVISSARGNIGERQKAAMERGMAMMKIRREYICPRCGKSAFRPQGTAPQSQ